MSKIYHVIVKNENMDTEDEGLFNLERFLDPLPAGDDLDEEEEQLSSAIKEAMTSSQICAYLSREAGEELIHNGIKAIYPCTVLGKMYLNME